MPWGYSITISRRPGAPRPWPPWPDPWPLPHYRQERSLLVTGIFHWVTATIPPRVRGASRQFFLACASVLAPGIQSGKRYSGLAEETAPTIGSHCLAVE